MSASQQICQLDGSALSLAYQKRDLSPIEVVRAALDRAEEAQATLNAFSFIDRNAALSAAREAEARWRVGEELSAIDGIPTTIKDMVPVKGWSVRYGSLTSDTTPHVNDAPAVSRLRSAGAVLIAQTTTPEFGWKAVTDSAACGITRNPWDHSRTPGGSSGGGAVAAACGAGTLHLGTDGGGSVRIPSAFTGVFGHKPTYGRVAFSPASSFGTVAHIGPIARTVRDASQMLEVMSGRDLADWTQPPTAFQSALPTNLDWRGKTIGYWKTPPVGGVDAEVAAGIESVLNDLRQAGAQITEFILPFSEVLLNVYERHWLVGAAYRLTTIDPVRHALLDPGFLEAAKIGRRITAVDRMEAELTRARFGAAMEAAFSEIDFIISPTVPILPFKVGHDIPPGSDLGNWVEWSSFSFPINLSQQPACSVPCGFSREGLPMGMQIIGPRGADDDVLGAAMAYEKMYPHRFLGTGGRWPECIGKGTVL